MKLPVTYIESHLKPFFWPALEDEVKLYGKKWQSDLSSIRDPADKFSYVTKTSIHPEKASKFVKTILSSDEITNSTRVFTIDEKDFREKTGNISFFIEISAFNQNHSVFAS